MKQLRRRSVLVWRLNMTRHVDLTGNAKLGSDLKRQTLKQHEAAAAAVSPRECGRRKRSQGLLRLAHLPTSLPPPLTPYALHLTPYALHPTPYTLHPTPYTLHPTLLLESVLPRVQPPPAPASPAPSSNHPS